MSDIGHGDFFTILFGDNLKITIVVGEVHTVATFEFDRCTNEGLALAINDTAFDDFTRWVILLRSLCHRHRGQGMCRACCQANASQQGA